MFRGPVYRVLYCLVRFVLFFWHPVMRVVGRENIPKDSRLIICSNHFSMSDPVWIVLAMRCGYVPRIMAKKEAKSYPVLGSIIEKLGVIFIDRGAADVHAIKEGFRCLRNEQQLLIFPEGTRVRDLKDSAPKRGAIMLAARTQTPVLPVYVSRKRFWLSPMTIIFGEPYELTFEGRKASDEDLERESVALMKKIYEMGENR